MGVSNSGVDSRDLSRDIERLSHDIDNLSRDIADFTDDLEGEGGTSMYPDTLSTSSSDDVSIVTVSIVD